MKSWNDPKILNASSGENMSKIDVLDLMIQLS